MESRKEAKARKRQEAKEKRRLEKLNRKNKKKPSHRPSPKGQDSMTNQNNGGTEDQRPQTANFHAKVGRHLIYANIIVFLALVILILFTIFV